MESSVGFRRSGWTRPATADSAGTPFGRQSAYRPHVGAVGADGGHVGVRGWKLFLGAGLSLAVLGIVLGPAWRPAIALASGCAGLGAMSVYVLRNRTSVNGPWKWILVGGALGLMAGVVRAIHSAVLDREVFPSLGEPLWVAGYLCLIIGLTGLRRLRTTESDPDGLVDGLIVASLLGLVSWAFVLSPYVRDSSIDPAGRLVNSGFSLLTVLAVVATVRLAVGPGARTTSYYLLACAIAVFFAADVAATLETAGLGYDWAPLLSPFMSSCMGAAALHPSMPLLTQQPAEPIIALRWRRVVLLGAALLMAPAILAWQLTHGTSADLPVVITGSVVLSLLVLTRLSLLVRANHRQTVLELELRQASSRLVAATTREDMSRIARATVERLAAVPRDMNVAVMIRQADGSFVPDAATRRSAGDEPEQPAMWDMPAVVLAPLLQRRTINTSWYPAPSGSTSRGSRWLLVNPLVSQNELRGAVVVTTRKPLAVAVRRAIESLTTTVSLALESAALSENLHLARSERRFRTLVEHASDIVLVVDDHQRISFVSPACQRLLGHSEAALLGTDPLDHVHSDDLVLLRSMLASPTAGLVKLSSLEIRIRHGDGGYRWFEASARDLRDEPDIGGVVLDYREINDRKNAELRLFHSEARFRALVQNVSDVVAIIDDRLRFTYVSRAVTPMLGFRPEDLIGTRATDLLAAPEQEEVRTQFMQLSTPAGTSAPVALGALEIRLRNAAGEWRTIDMTITDLRLNAAVGGIVLNIRDVTQRKALEHDLRHQAQHDALTGLPNRTKFTALVHESVEGHESKLPAGVLFIDLDDFKTVNDSLGHAVGDELLIKVAERLSLGLPTQAMPARLGGDEFGVLVTEDEGEAGPVRLAMYLINHLRRPFRVDGRDIAITASIGIAAINDRTPTAEIVLRNADMAMYLAKERGKDRVELFEEQMHASAFERLELKADLARGIESGQLRLVYQPIVSIQTGRITGVEALVRWDHPERGRLSPDAFIPLAEDTGLIVPLGQWVLEEACQQLRTWQLSLPTSATVSMSINLSVRQLERESIVDEVATVIDHFGLDPSTVTLEITETMIMGDTDMSSRRLAALQDVGVQLAIDDFGTGYSSLGYMEQFPIDVLKIDRSFVDGLGVRPATPVLQAIIELAQRLGVHVVAEGIERREQLEALQQLGCDLGQGYFFSGPVEADQLGDLLAASLVDGRRFLFNQGGPALG